MGVTSLSAALAAACLVAYFSLAVLLRPGFTGTATPRLRLRVAAVLTAFWPMVAERMSGPEALLPGLLPVGSVLVISLWLWQLEPHARWLGHGARLRHGLTWSGWIVLVFLLGWLLYAARTGAVAPPRPLHFALAGLVLATAGLAAIEQLYRNAPPEAQPALRWVNAGCGGIFLFELVAHAERVLVGGGIQGIGAARALWFLACAFALMRAAWLTPQWPLGVAVSRQLAFYAGTLVLVGAYLVLMSFAGWYLISRTGAWPPLLGWGFALTATIAFGALVFGGSGLVASMKVWINRQLYPQRYDYREEWLRFSRTLADPAAGALQARAIRAVGQIIGSPSGALWRRTPDGTSFECACQLPAADPPAPQRADGPLAAFLARTAWLVDIRETRQRPDLYEGLSSSALPEGTTDESLIVPLLIGESLYGWLVLERGIGIGELDFEDRDLLKVAGRQVAVHLAQYDADVRLAEAHQFETYNRMAAFVMHDLKNIAAQLRLVSQNAARHGRNPEFVDDAFRTVSGAASRMTRLIGQLRAGEAAGLAQRVDLADCAERAVRHCADVRPAPRVTAQARPVVLGDIERIASAIEHAVRNAQEATPPAGEVRVDVGETAGAAWVRVSDTGTGMDAQFVRDRLFRPFDTTKGERGMGIGAFQIREYMRSVGGDVDVRSEPGRGTQLTLTFPLPGATAGAALLAG